MAENWWDEEAERLNKMAKLAHKMGALVSVGPAQAPKLNADGTEQQLTLKEVLLKLKQLKKKKA